jgi:ubiquinone/menaquinone biosynthesis C-methylase UbiE
MSGDESAISQHYGSSDLGERILAALERVGIDLSNLTVDDLAPVDEFHIRGRAATEELASLADIGPSEMVLDVGSGVGGTSRFLASSVGCQVVGLDLTEEYCRIATMLTEKVGLGHRVRFQQGSALDMPFPDNSFDVVWTEHVQMNIAGKRVFYDEIRRVLKPGGRLAFHDIFSGPRQGLTFPVPWASDASISHLVGLEKLKSILGDLDFEPLHWLDKTDASIDFFNEVLPNIDQNGWTPLSLHLLVSEDPTPKFANVLLNLEGDRLRVIEAVFTKPL